MSRLRPAAAPWSAGTKCTRPSMSLSEMCVINPPISREQRAGDARLAILTQFTGNQQTFLDFVLSHYLSVGVAELDQEKLMPLLRLKYHNSIADAVADLGPATEINQIFAGFQKYLYAES